MRSVSEVELLIALSSNIYRDKRMVRYPNRHNQKGMLLLESHNPDFAAIDMPIKSIKHILQVRYIGKIEM